MVLSECLQTEVNQCFGWHLIIYCSSSDYINRIGPEWRDVDVLSCCAGLKSYSGPLSYASSKFVPQTSF